MVPAGYMYKRVAPAPPGMGPVLDVHSVSGCISQCFADYVPYWRHNGHWLFDSPEIIHALAVDNAIDLFGLTLFYYEVFGLQYDSASHRGLPFGAEPSLPTHVQIPRATQLEGYDVVTFSAQTSPECSPLSCNSLAPNLLVNQHCLFASFEGAKRSIDEGVFDHAEPGPFRVFAVHTVIY